GVRGREQTALQRAEVWLFQTYGKTPAELAEAVRRRYGKDRTFSVPILTMCALAGLVPWREVPPLPFELACLPQSWFRLLRLHVVSYALPALIAIGQVIYHHRPPWNPFTRVVRWLSKKRSLRVLARIQPSNGGFLEATPLTSFVTMSLAACGLADHVVARKGAEFIAGSVRPDGSWPIDTNLSTWVTTLAVNALASAGELERCDRTSELRDWLSRQQFRQRDAYTGADPGAWAWTPLPGGVPDADDTPGATLALAHLGSDAESGAMETAMRWLTDLQNADGGGPTFCRGWGHLPFDRSGSDLSAHAVRALFWWRKQTYHLESDPLTFINVEYDENGYAVDERVVRRSYDAIHKGIDFLKTHQRPDGSWLPLWFGNQHAPDDENPTYGTARVLAAYRDLDMMNTEPARRGVAWLLANQNADGGWGGCKGCPSSIEETALAVEILLDAGDAREPGPARTDDIPRTHDREPDAPAGADDIPRSHEREPDAPATGDDIPRSRVGLNAGRVDAAVNNGLAWLVQQVESGGLAK